MKKYLNKKGSALILVLSSLIILLALGTVVTMLSAANFSMSRKYSDWSKEYYRLDYAAQKRLSELDKNVLISSENMARYYLQNGCYQYDNAGSIPAASGIPTNISSAIGQNLQTIIHDEWIRIDAILNPPPPQEDGSGDAETEGEETETDALFEGLTLVERQAKYDDEMKDFIPRVFDVVYWTCVDSGLSVDPLNISDDPEGIDSSVVLQNTDWFPDIGAGQSLDSLHNALNELPLVEIKAWEKSAADPKQVKAEIEIIKPGYDAVEQTRYIAVKPNPLYANALSVQGRIIFTGGGGINISGDIVSNNLKRNGALYHLDEGNGDGIKAENGANVTITGNVYSGGDLHITGSGSSISVERYPDSYDDALLLKREYLYSPENPYFFDLGASGAANTEEYAEGKTSQGIVPYIYLDSLGGNVYCNNLAIETRVLFSSIDIAGNVWTRDDIQNDGQTGTSISIGGNFVGMRSDADEGDHNASSAIINNAAILGGTISIGGNYIIPGTSFYLFMGNDYYQTAESISAGAGEFFRIYVVEEDEFGSVDKKEYYISEDEYYWLFERDAGSSEAETLDNKIDRFISGIDSYMESKIDINRNADRYILGVGVNSSGNIVINSDDNSNYVIYSEVNESILPNVFEAKTRFFGTDGMSFYDLIDEDNGKSDADSGFYYYSGHTEVDVDSVGSGIIFCDGDLTLTGLGTFRGSVICSGDLTVNAGVDIQFSEEAVFEVLGFKGTDAEGNFTSGSRIARRFFSPGEYSVTPLGIEAYAVTSTAGEREDDAISRYIINSWREMKK